MVGLAVLHHEVGLLAMPGRTCVQVASRGDRLGIGPVLGAHFLAQ